MSTLEVLNYDEFEAAFNAAVSDLIVTSEQDLVTLAEDIAQRERASGPRGAHGGKHGIDTVEVTTGRQDKDFYVDVGPSRAGFYLAFYEFGTQHQPPRPFMRPAIAQAIAVWTANV
jgi:HK97 gp10 family phage protein